jgi:hypothetical protein
MTSLTEVAEMFGPELVDGVRTIIADQTAGLQNQVKAAEVKAANAERQTRRDRVMAELDNLHDIGRNAGARNWRQLNNDDRFVAWAKAGDPLYNIPRIRAMQSAFDEGRAGDVAGWFRRYLEGDRDPASPAPSSQRAGNGQKRTWSRQAIQDFYTACRSGKYDKDPDLRRRLEADIIAASRDGRISDPPFRGDDKGLLTPSGPPRGRFRYRATA